jgi:hypothetical protein
MPKKTLALISGLVLVTIVLFFVALRTGKEQMQQPQPAVSQPVAQQISPTVPVHTVLALSPNPLTVSLGQQGKVDVNIDTQDNAVTAVQLELSYDPAVVSNVVVTPGTMFANPVVLINKNDVATGRITYAFGITPAGKPIAGSGAVATITFTTKASAGKQAEISLLPSTLVTARGVASSVLKSATGTTVVVGSAGTMTETPKTTTVAP